MGKAADLDERVEKIQALYDKAFAHLSSVFDYLSAKMAAQHNDVHENLFKAYKAQYEELHSLGNKLQFDNDARSAIEKAREKYKASDYSSENPLSKEERKLAKEVKKRNILREEVSHDIDKLQVSIVKSQQMIEAVYHVKVYDAGVEPIQKQAQSLNNQIQSYEMAFGVAQLKEKLAQDQQQFRELGVLLSKSKDPDQKKAFSETRKALDLEMGGISKKISEFKEESSQAEISQLQKLKSSLGNIENELQSIESCANGMLANDLLRLKALGANEAQELEYSRLIEPTPKDDEAHEKRTQALPMIAEENNRLYTVLLSSIEEGAKTATLNTQEAFLNESQAILDNYQDSDFVLVSPSHIHFPEMDVEEEKEDSLLDGMDAAILQAAENPYQEGVKPSLDKFMDGLTELENQQELREEKVEEDTESYQIKVNGP